MQLRELYTDDRAVSPVVGVALLIAIAVILAAVIGAVVLGLGTGGVDTPQAQLQSDFTGDETFDLSHQGGEPLPADEVSIIATTGQGTTDTAEMYEWNGVDELEEDEEVTAGSTVSFDAGELNENIAGTGEEIVEFTVVWEDPNSDSETVLEEFEK